VARPRTQGGRSEGATVEIRKIATQKIEPRFEQGESVRVEFKGEEGGPPAHPGDRSEGATEPWP